MKPDRPIYLDYHASTPVDPRVIASMEPYLADHFANPHSSEHAAGWYAESVVEAASNKLASAMGSDDDEIIFTSGATEANNLAILGLARRAPSSRRRILVGSIEHKSVLAAASAVEPLGFIVEPIRASREGTIDLAELNHQMGEDILLVSVQAVNSEIGTIQPVKEVVASAHRYGALVHCDAAQALAAGPLSFRSSDIDLLSLSGHKIYGPKGIGALFIRREIQDEIEPLMYGGGQQRSLRPGTLPVPLCVGLAEAVSIITGPNADSERIRLRYLRDLFVAGLSREIGQINLNGPDGSFRHPGNANIQFPGLDGRDILGAVQPNLAASTGSACASGTLEPSYVLKTTGLSNTEAESSIRFCIGRFTTESEIHAAVEILASAIERLRFPIG